ncbi:hypothetical protein DICPUDRAFT_79283 [Dictyostelium purpureum]|uniref:Uncharacterized protein n=1 Tax=Dictyostelium purpureum TaxID=5786 RepID=F0ZM45_DICPU|nr:uncharacterized protein DICPUDRAFT_79283 [Dictyostelium purpureum]EGC34982.1 hypothetical protein DICPUDRAFT_79283 [Dictyostelium purpureum]|eukprot:XP_003288507.1 hypothetical protein DICPUDRAFT_79283 [Dictyostelium purpureum]
MKLVLLLLLVLNINFLNSENIEFLHGTNGNYLNPNSWSLNRVPGPNDDASISNSYVSLEGASSLEMPNSLVVQDNSVFDISQSELVNYYNSSILFSDSSLSFTSVKFTTTESEITFNFVDVIVQNSLTFENAKQVEFVDTLLVARDGNIQISNSTLKITGSSNLVSDISIDQHSVLIFSHNYPRELGTPASTFIDVYGDLIINNSELNKKVNFTISSQSSNILINGGSYVDISEEKTQFNTPATIYIDEGSVISIDNYIFKNSLNVRGGSSFIFKNSQFYYEPSHHYFAPGTPLNFEHSVLYLGNSGGAGLGNTNTIFYSNTIVKIQSLSVQLGVVDMQYASIETDSFYYSFPIWIYAHSLTVTFGSLDLGSISVYPTIQSSLPVLIGYSASIYGNGKVNSDIYVYGNFSQIDKTSKIDINGSLVLSPYTNFNVRINSLNSFTKVNVAQFVDLDDAILNISINDTSVERGVPFTFIKYFDAFENSTLFSQAFVSFDNEEITYSLSCYINNCTIIFIQPNTGSSSESSSSNSGGSSESSSGSYSENSSSNNGSSSESSSSNSGGSSESSLGSNSENSSSGGNSESSSSSNGSSSESSSSWSSSSWSSSSWESSWSSSESSSSSGISSESSSNSNGNSSESSSSWSSSSWESSSSSWEPNSSEQSSSSWESSSSEDFSIICTFNPISYVLHVVNHAYKSEDDFSIVCTGRGKTKCFNDHFACKTGTNQSSVVCETNKEITCIGLDVKCNILNKFKCETIPPTSPVETATPLPTTTPSITPSTLPTNQTCSNIIPNSYCWNGKVYCYPPYSGSNCDIVNVQEIKSTKDENNNSNNNHNNNSSSKISIFTSSSIILIIMLLLL